MKKDIQLRKVTDVAIAVVPKEDDPDNTDFWNVYIINLKEETLSSVLIASRGYGEIDGEIVQTSTLRHFFEEISPLEMQLIEPLDSNILHLSSEYWVSFSLHGYLYDRKYIFVPGSIDKVNFTLIPFINKMGVMIR
ncbi:MAG: hypothetical protein KA974_05715 [Saprospiraceae bacterium]|nr:hypothetical protein [Saprospiraceae bacterium]